MNTTDSPIKLINHDFMPRIKRQERREAMLAKRKAESRAELIDASKKFIGAILIFAALAFISHMASAAGNKKTQIARATATQNNLEHAGDCYGAQAYLDASDRPEHLVSPEMAVFITLHGHGGNLTECDMQ
jgi:hypothetical protein